jgi:hypothetical protein
MRKLAILAEGQTELLFCERLVRFIGQARGVAVAVQKQAHEGGRPSNPRRLVELGGDTESGEHAFFVLLVSCGQDQRVLSDVCERYASLAARGYEAIIAIRDVHPKRRAAIPALRDAFRRFVPNTPVPAALILAIMEIEAWFLAEHTHLARVHAELSPDVIARELGFDPRNDDVQLREVPSRDLRDAYLLVKLFYDKSRACVERTLECLDLELVCSTLCTKSEDLGRLVQRVEDFFAHGDKPSESILAQPT